MSEVPVWIPLISVLVGALASGGIQAVLREIDRRREQRSILNAISSEVAIICELIRFRKYLPLLKDTVEYMELNTSENVYMNADFTSNYFSVFESLSSSLGKIRADQAQTIVRFYATCKASVESLRPDGSIRQITDPQVVLEHHKQLYQLLQGILMLGDEIIQFAGHGVRRAKLK
jgi:hypothetical protein